MKVQIDLPQDVYQKLKEEASAHFQSLRGHIAYRLISQIRGTNVIDLSSLPAGTTIRTTTATASTTKPAPRRDIIQEAYDKEGIFEDRIHRTHEPFTDEEYKECINSYYPYCQNNKDFIQLKNYYDSFNHTPEELYEARERFIALPQIFECQEHERPYLLQVFDFVPPTDEPGISITTYITQLARGGYYEDDEQHLFLKK